MSSPAGGSGSRIARVTRRDFFVAVGSGALAGGAGLVLGVWYGQQRERWSNRVPDREQPFAPNVYLAIDTDGVVTVWLTRSEMGQGVSTALPMLVADELEADFGAIRIEQAIASRTYGSQLTGSSASVSGLWQPLRQAGASAREMLVAAAAARWGVPGQECGADQGHVVHRPSGRRTAYGALVRDAARLPVPNAPRLKSDGELRLVGTSVPRVDVPSKVDGRARYGIDVRLAGMRYATVVRCPVFGGKAESVDFASVRSQDGVVDAFEIEAGVAIVAETTWHAFRAAQALQVRWQDPAAGRADSVAHREALEQALDGSGASVLEAGDVARWSLQGGKAVEARYHAPYLAHATMEPINATAWMHDGRCEIWAPTQAPQNAQAMAAELTGLPLPDVIVNITQLGGGFGRRAANAEVRDAVQIAQRVDYPVQVVWTREQDVQHDFYRPISSHRMEAVLDGDGMPRAYRHHIATPSMLGKDSSQGEVDKLMVEGSKLPYAIDRVEVRWTSVPSPVPLGFWRSVAHSYTAFAVECFIDEIARAGGKDPLELRRAMLQGSPRDLAVLERAAELIGWAEPPAAGVGRGIALHPSFGSHVAMATEVRMDDGGPRVLRVAAAVDCGRTVHPQTIEAQIEGGIVFGLTAALYGRIDVREGRVVQSNFHDYRMLRLGEMPEVRLAILPSEEAPSGVGEIGVPPIAPAVANAIAALTGKPVRALPLIGG